MALKLTKIELELLKHLPPEYKLHHKETNNVLLIQVKLDAAALKLFEKSAKILQFDILVPTNFPLVPPTVRTLSSVCFHFSNLEKYSLRHLHWQMEGTCYLRSWAANGLFQPPFLKLSSQFLPSLYHFLYFYHNVEPVF